MGDNERFRKTSYLHVWFFLITHGFHPRLASRLFLLY
jgi:hypothetical protein